MYRLDFGLDLDYSVNGKIIRDSKTGKPRVKLNKKNFEQFTKNFRKFIKNSNSERIQP